MQEDKTGHIYFILGTSGAWKDTLMRNIKKSAISEKIDFVISYKSRARRESETHWVDAHFVSVAEFKEMIDQDEFIEVEKVYGDEHFYGTRTSDLIENGINKWKTLIKEIDMEGLKNILIDNPDLQQYITGIFLDLSTEKFEERVLSRWEVMDEKAYALRLKAYSRESADAKKYCDYIIDTSEKTPEEVLEEAVKILNV